MHLYKSIIHLDIFLIFFFIFVIGRTPLTILAKRLKDTTEFPNSSNRWKYIRYAACLLIGYGARFGGECLDAADLALLSEAIKKETRERLQMITDEQVSMWFPDMAQIIWNSKVEVSADLVGLRYGNI